MSEGGKETCGHRVVPAGTLAAHALPHLIPPPYLIHGRREALTSLRPGWAAVLHVVCDDTGPYAPAGPDAQSLTSDQVTAILQFVRDHLGWRRLVLHCAAGVPRSRSVTAAVAEIVGLPYVWTALNGVPGVPSRPRRSLSTIARRSSHARVLRPCRWSHGTRKTPVKECPAESLPSRPDPAISARAPSVCHRRSAPPPSIPISQNDTHASTGSWRRVQARGRVGNHRRRQVHVRDTECQQRPY